MTTETDSAPDPLAPVKDAIARGDLVEARQLAEGLAKDADPAVRAKGEAAVAQLGVDPVTVAVMAATGVLMGILVVLYLHAH